MLLKKHFHVVYCMQRGYNKKKHVGVARDTVFQEIRPGAGFKTRDFVEEDLVEGATVERRHR